LLSLVVTSRFASRFDSCLYSYFGNRSRGIGPDSLIIAFLQTRIRNVFSNAVSIVFAFRCEEQ
jgi:hypothetical protein